MSSGEKVLQQPAHLVRLLAGGAIRVENGDFLYCFSPTGNNGVSRLCTRVLNDIAHIRGAACHLIRLAASEPPSPQGEGFEYR